MQFDRSRLADLSVFATIVRRQSIKQAAHELGLTSSALSHRLRKLEADLGVRLVNRTSRSLTPTEVGAALAAQIEAALRLIGDALATLTSQHDAPSGRLRINVLRDAARHLLAPALPRYAELYPGMSLDVTIDDHMIDIVAEGFDAGIRYGDRVPQDMIGVALSAPQPWIVVGAPALIARVGRPQSPEELLQRPCVEMRLGDNSRYAWELGNAEELRRVDVRGPLCANESQQTIDAALGGIGFAYCLEALVGDHLASGRLELVLPEWRSDGPPFMIYYPSRRQLPPGMRLLIALIRQQQGLPPLAMDGGG